MKGETLSDKGYVAFEVVGLACGTADVAGVGVDPWQAEGAAVGAVPALVDILALVDTFAPAVEDGNVV